jgi:S-formylglutathione hydrolase FrmB
MTRHVVTLVAVVAAAGIVAGSDRLRAQAPVPASTAAPGTLDRITVHGKSLEGNLNGDTADRPVIVYLPPSYQQEPNRRYPVVYLLHGYGLQASRWLTLFRIENGANQAMSAPPSAPGQSGAREMILVNPDAFSRYDGSFYSNSVTAGDWETFIADELVAYIDSHYRTLPRRESRGLAGHSMGGYGTLRIGMKRPDAFSALYMLSAGGVLEKGEPTDAIKTAATYTTRDEVGALRYPNKGTHAKAAAWSPNPQNPPFFLDLPIKDGVARPEIQAKWIANSLVPMLDQYALALKRMKAIRFDVGLADGLLEPNRQLDAAMTQAGLPHVFETYEGYQKTRFA